MSNSESKNDDSQAMMKAKKLQELREQLEKSKKQGEEDNRKYKSM